MSYHLRINDAVTIQRPGHDQETGVVESIIDAEDDLVWVSLADGSLITAAPDEGEVCDHEWNSLLLLLPDYEI